MFAVLALAATIGLAGCEGDSGPSGPDTGGGGNGGQTGPTGPTGPADTPITLGGDVSNVGNGSALTAQQIADIGTLVATLDSATVAEGKPVIEITVKTPQGGKVLGLAASALRLGIAKLVPAGSGLPSRWQSYINTTGTTSIPTPALASAIQATVENGTAAGWEELGAGRYRYTSTVDLTNVTSPIAVSYQPTLTHRASIAIDLSGNARPLAPDNAYLDFVPAGGTATSKLVTATEKCATCHVRFAEHGGPRRSTEFCVVCHNPGTVDPDSGESVELAYMAHSIHRGSDRTQPYIVYGYRGSLFDASDIEYPQPVAFCETCHEQSAATPQGDDWKATTTAAACGGCHVDGLQKTGPDPATGRYAYSFRHPANPDLPPDFVVDDGGCTGCHGPGKTVGDNLAVHQADTDRRRIEEGRKFKYEILSVENAVAGQAPKVTFRITDSAGNPLNVKTLPGRLRLDFAWTGKDIHNVADIAAGTLASARGTALSVNFDTDRSALVDNGNGTYSYTLAQPLPSGFSDANLGTGLMVVLEGRRDLPDGSRAYPNSAVAFGGGPARPELVVQAKCENCHEQVSAHGGGRAGNPLVCTACHNSSAGGTWNANNLGPLAMGAFVHKLHKGVEETYPQSLARCEACHASSKVYFARTDALPLTMDANTTLSTGAEALLWTDDKADSATAGTCKGCHDSGEAIAHMTQQGGYFGQPKLLQPSASVEGCALCHDAGRSFDVAKAHCGALPYGQCTNN